MSRKVTSTTIEVDIFGTSYHVRGDNDPEHLTELAGFVDEKMKEVSSHVTTVDATKIAILAALNIADELFRSRQGRDGERKEISEKVTGLAGELEAVLKS